jgi:hypothetical protein
LSSLATVIIGVIKGRREIWVEQWHVRGEERCVQGLVGKLEGKRLIVRQRLRWGEY